MCRKKLKYYMLNHHYSNKYSMNDMCTMLYDIIRKIFYMSDVEEQIKLRNTCKLFNTFPILYFGPNITYKISNRVLESYQTLSELDINNHNNITDEGIKNLAQLQILRARSTKITDKGIKNLTQLQTLDAYGTIITDEGIKNLTQLQSLDISHTYITDEGIKNLTQLHSLYTHCSRITYE